MAAGRPRQTVDALFASLEREPSEFDCVVEGRKDATVLNWVFRQEQLRGARAIEIGDIEVPKALFPDEDVQGGNRARVVKVSELAATRFPDGDAPLRCLADRDTADLVTAPHP